MSKAVLAAVAASAITIGAGVLGAAAPAAAGDEDVIRATGACTGGGTWELKGKHDDGGIEWEFEVDINRNGLVWRVRVRDNGDLVMSGSATTLAPSGSFEVERTTADKAGPDRIVARATRGERLCVGRITV